MLAYVFWHWPRASVAAERYEAELAGFHRSLADRRPNGYLRSTSFRVRDAPWAAARPAAYEDWYLLDGFAALGAIEHDAMAPPHRRPHDRVAESAGGGTAGLYRPWLGEPDPGSGAVAWFSKPEGMSYDALRELLSPLSARGGSVWVRRLVLGPAPEFRFSSESPVALPQILQAIRTETAPFASGDFASPGT